MRRLYVGGLSHTISHKDLKDRFGKFGEVTDVEIVTRNNEDGTPCKTFGYININISETDLKKCMTVLNKSKWKGGTLQIEMAKESFLSRLAEERQQALEKAKVPCIDPKETLVESLKKAGVENFHLKAAVPGTEIPGHKDWVVSKYGRVLPVLQLKCQGKKRIFKYDPSKHCHNIKKLESTSDVSTFTPVAKLTWTIPGGDDEISKKRRGEFPPQKVRPKKMRQDTSCSIDVDQIVDSQQIRNWNKSVNKFTGESGCLPKNKQNSTVLTRPQKSVRVLDSDDDSEEEIRMLMAKEWSHSSRDTTVEDDSLEVVGDNFVVKPTMLWSEVQNSHGHSGPVEEDGEYDSADTDEILTTSKAPGSVDQKKEVSTEAENTKSERTSCRKKKKADRNIPTPSSALSQSGSSSSEDSENSLDSDYEAMMSNCTRLDISLTDLENLAKQSAASSGEEMDDLSHGASEAKPNSGDSKAVRKNKNAINPEDILASLLGASGSDNEYDRKKKKINKNKGCTLPPFMGTKSLFGSLYFAQSESCLKGQMDRAGSETNENTKKQKSNKHDVETVGVHPKVWGVACNGDRDSFPSNVTVPEKNIRSASSSGSDSSCSEESEEPEANSLPPNGGSSNKEMVKLQLDRMEASRSEQKEEVSEASSSKDSESSGEEEQILPSKTNKKAEDSVSSSESSESSAEEENVDQGKAAPKPSQKAIAGFNDEQEPLKKPPRRLVASEAEKQQQDNQRRLAALEQRLRDMEQQKKFIQGALSKVDTQNTNKSKHIVFGSEDESEGEVEETQRKSFVEMAPENPKKTGGKKLFDSSEDEEEDESSAEDDQRFQIKPQFEGKAGQKLMQLQSRFGTDERFQMDSRFLESDDETEVVAKNAPLEPMEDELIEEKKKNLDILQSVLNINIQPSEASKESTKSKKFRDMSALHYDPTREEHAAFEKKKEEPKKESKAARRKKREEAEKLPEVSKDIFYETAVDLKEVFGSTKQREEEKEVLAWDKEDENEDGENSDANGDTHVKVTLLTANETKNDSSGFKFSFFADDETAADTSADKGEYKIEILKGAKMPWQVEPRFQDSSSEDEDVEEDDEEGKEHTTSAPALDQPTEPKKSYFFFYQDDERLKDGPKMFCRSMKLEDQREEWEERRTLLIEDYRKKHKDAQRQLKMSHRK
ncbi:nucleolar protein 8 isoform X2 [Denticeps clupeoides]|uniref:nucleolar protein 8 isoform X2 n=1 Tax=Denticeps clupeoides TaxID=299321 RepID=UPI0010A38FC6|nr:nucleolar protein 8 isoform X2 [Denticeps clupeoides]